MNLRKKIIILTSILIFILMASGIVFGAYSYKRSVSSKDIGVGKLEINSKKFINYSNENLRVDTVVNLSDIILVSETEYNETKDSKFESGKNYYVLGTYTKASVIVGDNIPANTYYEDIDGGYKYTTSTTFQSGVAYYTKTSDSGYTKTSTVSIDASISGKYYEAIITYTGIKEIKTVEGAYDTCSISETDSKIINVADFTITISEFSTLGIKSAEASNDDYSVYVGNDHLSLYVIDTTKSSGTKTAITDSNSTISCSATKDKKTASNIYLNQLGFEFEFTNKVACYVRIRIKDAWHSTKVYSSNNKETYSPKDKIDGVSPFVTSDSDWYYDSLTNILYLKTSINAIRTKDGYTKHSYTFNVNPAYFYISNTKTTVYKEYIEVDVSFEPELVQANRAKAIWGVDPSEF